MIEVNNLTKRYGATVAVDNVSLMPKREKYWDFLDQTVRARQQPCAC